jgi:hypothetical protein
MLNLDAGIDMKAVSERINNSLSTDEIIEKDRG